MTASEVMREHLNRLIDKADAACRAGAEPPSADVAADALLSALYMTNSHDLAETMRSAWRERDRFIVDSGGAGGGTWGSDAEFEEELRFASFQKRTETIEDVARESIPWAHATFTSATIHTRAAHLAAEAMELKANPHDPHEMADVLLLLTQMAHDAGVNLAEAMRAKFEIAKTRQWGEPNAEGFVEHVREAATTQDGAR